MNEDGSFVIWIVLAAIPIGLLMISGWSRARPPGESDLKSEARDADRTR